MLCLNKTSYAPINSPHQYCSFKNPYDDICSIERFNDIILHMISVSHFLFDVSHTILYWGSYSYFLYSESQHFASFLGVPKGKLKVAGKKQMYDGYYLYTVHMEPLTIQFFPSIYCA